MMIDDNEEQQKNAFFEMKETDKGMEIDVNDEQKEKARSPMDVTESGN